MLRTLRQAHRRESLRHHARRSQQSKRRHARLLHSRPKRAQITGPPTSTRSTPNEQTQAQRQQPLHKQCNERSQSSQAERLKQMRRALPLREILRNMQTKNRRPVTSHESVGHVVSRLERQLVSHVPLSIVVVALESLDAAVLIVGHVLLVVVVLVESIQLSLFLSVQRAPQDQRDRSHREHQKRKEEIRNLVRHFLVHIRGLERTRQTSVDQSN